MKHNSILRRTIACTLLLCTVIPPQAAARTAKGDALLARARMEEAKDNTAALDAALKLVEQAFETDRTDISYQLELARFRAFAAQYHVYDGQVTRDKGNLKEALIEFEKAIQLDPASVVAPQEAARTREMIRILAENPKTNLEELHMRPLPLKNKRDEELYANSAAAPKLNVSPKNPLPVIKVNNQQSNEVFLALAKDAGIRVLFDPEYQSRSLGFNQTLDLSGLSVEQALDYVGLVTKSFWKPLSSNTIFISNDDQQRRAAYEEQVTKSFYLTNAPVLQEVNDIAQTVQRVTDIRKLFVHAEQNVIVARADADRIALAEKVIADLDKPKSEIIIDVIILSVTKNWARDLGVSLGLDGSNLNINFSPAPPPGSFNTSSTGRISLDSLTRLSAGDYSVTLPSVALSALLATRGVKVMDKAQLRTVEGQKSTLKIGQKVPYATGSFSPGIAGGISAIVNTQFQYFDVGLNIDVIAKVHEPDEVSLHIESDTSSVADRVDLGGVRQPVIAQRKRIADVRVKEGEVNLWDIVTGQQDLKSTSGIPGLSQIPVLGRVFTQERLEKSELQVLTLLVPHIIRAPDIRNVNLMGIASGNDQVVRMRYGTPHPTPEATPRVLELAPSAAPAGAPVQPQQQQVQTLQQPQVQTQQAATPAPSFAGGAARAAAIASFQPRTIRTQPNTIFSADLNISGLNDLREGTITLKYDPRLLKLLGVNMGVMGLQTPGGITTGDGTITIKLNPTSKDSPEAGAIGTLTFLTLGPGTSQLERSEAKLIGNMTPLVTLQYTPLEVIAQ